MRIKKMTVAVVAACLLWLVAAPAHAVALMVIQGTVSDPLDRPLQGVGVTDGQDYSTRTDAGGRYVIEEEYPSTYRMFVWKKGLNPQSRVVDPLEARDPNGINFTLTYTLSGFVSPSTLSNSGGPVALAIAATSFAPVAGQCVTFTDSTSGAQVALGNSTPTASDGSSLWTGTFDIPPTRTDGVYRFRIDATDCGSVALTNELNSTFVIDSVPPTRVFDRVETRKCRQMGVHSPVSGYLWTGCDSPTGPVTFTSQSSGAHTNGSLTATASAWNGAPVLLRASSATAFGTLTRSFVDAQAIDITMHYRLDALNTTATDGGLSRTNSWFYAYAMPGRANCSDGSDPWIGDDASIKSENGSTAPLGVGVFVMSLGCHEGALFSGEVNVEVYASSGVENAQLDRLSASSSARVSSVAFSTR